MRSVAFIYIFKLFSNLTTRIMTVVIVVMKFQDLSYDFHMRITINIDKLTIAPIVTETFVSRVNDFQSTSKV